MEPSPLVSRVRGVLPMRTSHNRVFFRCFLGRIDEDQFRRHTVFRESFVLFWIVAQIVPESIFFSVSRDTRQV